MGHQSARPTFSINIAESWINPMERTREAGRAGSLSKEMSGVVAYIRKEQGFVREIYTGSQAVIPLPDLDIELTLADVYADVEFYSRGGLNPLRDNSANN